MNIYTDMFVTFFKVGLFTIGGGYAMIPMVENDVVRKKRWLGSEEFIDILAVAQAAPGLFAINMATYISMRIAATREGIRGWLLGLVGSLGVALPSVIVILLIAMFFQSFKNNPWVMRFFMGMRPAVVALILVPCLRMFKTAKISVNNIWIPISACALISFCGISPVLIVLCAVVCGFVYGKMKGGRR
ncbi:MAG: chromate transporter [Bacteroidaceae bacterium]|nr:chromate transporter [Bacteroidaceae bacterium]